MTISFAKFVEMLDSSSSVIPKSKYKIPEYVESFIKDMENNKRYCVVLHRHAGRATIRKLCNKYLDRGDKNEII